LPDAREPIGNIPTPDSSTPSEAVPATPSFSVHNVFLGRDGLRAGWSLLLYAVLIVVLNAGSGLLIQEVHLHRVAKTHAGAAAQAGSQQAEAGDSAATGSGKVMPPKVALVGEGVAFLCAAVATWVMAKIERRPNATFGLGRRHGLRTFLAGLGWGVALLSLLILSLRVTGLLVFDARLLFGRSALRYGAVWFAAFLLVGLFEEYFFRGYLQFTLARGLSGIYGWFGAPVNDTLGFWTSAVLLSFGFGFTHKGNAGESPIGLLSAGIIGVVFCLSLWRTGSLWWAIGFHAAWDWAQSFLYGVADSGTMVEGHLFSTHPVGRPILSGGLTGPEGSIFILPIVALTTGVIVFTLRNGRANRLGRDAQPELRAELLHGSPDDARQPRLHLDLP